MIESPVLVRIVDLLIIDRPILHAFLGLGFLQAYLAPQLLKRPTWRPPVVVLVAALAFFLLSVAEIALGSQPLDGRRVPLVSLWVAAMLVGGWAAIALVVHLRRLAAIMRAEQVLTARPEARC